MHVDAYSLILGLFMLTDRQRYVTVQRHLRSRTCDDIAEELHLSKQRISAIEQRGLEKLRDYLLPFRVVLDD